MVGGKCRLVAVHRLGALGQHQAGVVHQHVDPRRLLEDLRRTLADGGQVGQVEDDELDPALTDQTVA